MKTIFTYFLILLFTSLLCAGVDEEVILVNGNVAITKQEQSPKKNYGDKLKRLREKQENRTDKKEQESKKSESPKEKTPETHPDDFKNVKKKKGKQNLDTKEVWEKDLLHGDHWEVYKDKEDYLKGKRDRTVWSDGRLKGIYK